MSSTKAQKSEAIAAQSNIKHVIAVMSGKGGVGKSSVTALLAIGARREGLQVGILDADITGPSIPKMFGLQSGKLSQEQGFAPRETALGIKIMSLNLLLQNEDDPVIWRGPLIGGTIKQFWKDVDWGELDYLFIDLPPGTADAPLTVMQSIPLDGLVIVSSPQELSVMVVKKALKMAELLKVPVLGLVENMSGLTCPHCGEQIEVFGPSRGEEIAALTNVPFLLSLPFVQRLAASCDQGTVEEYQSNLFPRLLTIQAENSK
jgi:Mrp family chromosome partitioning ATPase